jgi:hypothetical protein
MMLFLVVVVVVVLLLLLLLLLFQYCEVLKLWAHTTCRMSFAIFPSRSVQSDQQTQWFRNG